MEAITRIVADELAEALKHETDRGRDVTESEKAAYCERRRSYWENVASWIKDKSEVYRKAQRGAFHRSNKNTRRIFTFITGIALPSTTRDTIATIRQYVGPDTIAMIEHEEWLEAEAAKAEREAERQAEAAKHAAEMEKLKAAILADSPITGSQLDELATYLDLEVHPRTIGSCRKNIVTINSNQARFYGKAFPEGARRVYRTVRQALLDALEECDNDAEVEQLFGR
jgi:hypothetical protein